MNNIKNKNRNRNRNRNRGSSLLEVIMAIGLFAIITSNIVVLYLGAFSSNLHDKEKLEATAYLIEGTEALRSIKDFNFSNLTNGTYGLSKANGYWELLGSSDINGQFTRAVTISDVRRDSNCDIVASGGTPDPNSKFANVQINWELEKGNATSISAEQYFNNWKNPTVCSLPANIVVDVTNISLQNGNKDVVGITIENTGGQDITIDKILVSWTGGASGNKLKTITINGTDVWTGTASSGTDNDITDFVLTAGAGPYTIDKLSFSKNIQGGTLSITFTMLDTSQTTVSNIAL